MATNNSTNQSATGIQSLTSGGVYNGRTITGTSNQISVTNGDGTAGNPTLALTSTIYVSGISFDSGSNSLTSFSAGTFTPTLTASSSNPTVGYAANGQVGYYERVGKMVAINARIQLSSISGGSGDTQLSNLPFTSQSATNSTSPGACSLSTITFGASVLYYQVSVSTNSTLMILPGVRSATTPLNLVIGGVASTSVFEYQCNYNVA